MSHVVAYQVGDLTAFQANDPVFTGECAYIQALTQALSRSVENQDTPYGLWTTPDDGSELLVIVHNGEVFTK